MSILAIAFLVFVLNIPFGYWRANVRKFSLPWFLSVHVPVPFVIALRLFSGLGFQLVTFPIIITAYFGGQYVGSKIYHLLKIRYDFQVSSCLVMDLLGRCQKQH